MCICAYEKYSVIALSIHGCPLHHVAKVAATALEMAILMARGSSKISHCLHGHTAQPEVTHLLPYSNKSAPKSVFVHSCWIVRKIKWHCKSSCSAQ